MKRTLCVIAAAILVWGTGCAELTQTVRIFNTALIELFRLPIYIIRLPFSLLQNMGPIIQSGVRSAANVAPLLLFIENQSPPRRLDPDPARPGRLEESVKIALASPGAAPLLPLLDRETAEGPGRRFILVDARLAEDPACRAALIGPLEAGAGAVTVARVDGGGIFAERERFLRLARRMRARGDILVAATSFNGALASLAGLSPPSLPDDPGDRAFVLGVNRSLRGLESRARRGG